MAENAYQEGTPALTQSEVPAEPNCVEARGWKVESAPPSDFFFLGPSTSRVGY